MTNNTEKLPFLEGNKPLKEVDPEIYAIILEEQKRQWRGLEMIASENFTSRAVMDCLGSCLTNKYSEGQIGKRYYGGNENIDKIEQLCKDRCLGAFGLSADQWAVNVQPYSGSTANFAALSALLAPHERLMGLGLPSGGHLTHGYYTSKKKISSTSIFFESLPYSVNEATGLVDYDALEQQAKVYMPRLIICGASAYPRDWDYARLSKIAKSVGAYLMADIAHFSGLIAAGEHNSPFEHCDVVTSTTHKSLRGPRAGLIFTKRDERQLTEKVDFSVFPGCQGGPHNHQIAAIATQMREVATPEFKAYAQQVKKNANALAQALMKRGYKLATDGTDNHLILWNLRPLDITGSKLEQFFDMVDITVNKNSIAGDKSALTPMGIRLGTPALTTRGMVESDMEQVVEYLHRGVQISLSAQQETSGKLLNDFLITLKQDKYVQQMDQLRSDVVAFSTKFGIPGFDPAQE